MKTQKLTLLIFSLFSLMYAFGEKAPEQRKDASHVVIGEVTEVFKSEGLEYIGYVVRISVEKVVKGKGFAKGQYFYAECFDRNPYKGLGTPPPGASGHSGIPKVGDRIRVFTKEEKLIYAGVYPDWFDALPKLSEK